MTNIVTEVDVFRCLDVRPSKLARYFSTYLYAHASLSAVRLSGAERIQNKLTFPTILSRKEVIYCTGTRYIGLRILVSDTDGGRLALNGIWH